MTAIARALADGPNPPRVQRRTVDSHEIIVVDHAWLPSQLEAASAWAEHAPFVRATYKYRTHDDPTERSAEQSLCPVHDPAALNTLGVVVMHQMAQQLLGRTLEVSHAHINRVEIGEDRYPHIDARHPGLWVAVLCLNDRWEPRWGGELVFYASPLEAHAAVGWAPGRMIIFPASLPHRGGVPNSEAPDPRYALALKLQVPGREQMIRQMLGKAPQPSQSEAT